MTGLNTQHDKPNIKRVFSSSVSLRISPCRPSTERDAVFRDPEKKKKRQFFTDVRFLYLKTWFISESGSGGTSGKQREGEKDSRDVS